MIWSLRRYCRDIGIFMLHKKWIMDYWSFHSLWMRIRIHLCKAMMLGSCIQQTYICLQSYIKTLSSAAGLEIWYKILFLSFLLVSVIFIILFFIAERKLSEHIGKKKKSFGTTMICFAFKFKYWFFLQQMHAWRGNCWTHDTGWTARPRKASWDVDVSHPCHKG